MYCEFITIFLSARLLNV